MGTIEACVETEEIQIIEENGEFRLYDEKFSNSVKGLNRTNLEDDKRYHYARINLGIRLPGMMDKMKAGIGDSSVSLLPGELDYFIEQYNTFQSKKGQIIVNNEFYGNSKGEKIN